MHSKGFPPFARADARVLILGTLPGQASLAAEEYYAYPRNAFWPIMGELAGAFPHLPYEARMLRLNEKGIALWDVCAQGFRPGSLDSNISKPAANDFRTFFRTHPHIKLIAFNGQPASALYRRLVLPGLPHSAQAIPREILPSTSPAHASLSFAQKLARWREVVGIALGDSI
jgi:hypoxanthine-DNA glycosylase